MSEVNKNKEAYTSELEDKIVDLSLQLKSTTNKLKLVSASHKNTIGKLVHNLKNPVGVIFSFSDMILEDLEEYTTEKLQKHLQIINNSANFSIQLLGMVAKYSQLQSPDFVYTLKLTNYTELITSVLNEFTDLASKKNCTIVTNIPSSAINLNIDAAEISLAIRNIINNALRYSNENSTITITVKEHEKTIETTITDEGIGVSEENLPLVFNDFFVVNTYSDDKQKCIGLGLSVANIILIHHKGKISAESNLNEGSSFKVFLPKKELV